MTEPRNQQQPDGARRAIEARDDAPHEHGGERGWSERLSMNFFDASSGLGGIAAMEFWPGDRRAEASVSIFLPEGAFALALARADNAKRAGLSVGRLAFELVEPLETMKVRCKDVALVFPTVGSARVPQAGERHGAAAQIDLDLVFGPSAAPTGFGARRTDMSDQHFLSVVSSGVLVQPGHITGSLRVGNRTEAFDGYGFRDRVWGARDDSASVARVVSFGPELALSAVTVQLGDTMFEDAAVFRDGALHAAAVTVGAKPEDFVLTDDTGERFPVAGEILGTIPVGAEGPRRARSMVRFRCGTREALGLIEQGGGETR